MQSCGVLVALIFLFAPRDSCATSETETAAAAQEVARTWFEAHSRSVQPDELDDLKNANPDAYALVKALLTKRSLGLLDPRHPTASFSPAKPVDDADQPSGAAAFAKFASPGELSQGKTGDEVAADVPAVYAEAPTPVHHDWLNWKPTDSAAESDESMVQNVLGAVAQLKGGSAANLLSQSRGSESTKPASGLEADDSMFSGDAAPSAPVAPKDPPKLAMPAVVQQASSTEGNSYLKSIDFSEDLPKAAPPVAKDNVYLKVFNPSTATSDSPSSSNALASFSFDDNKPVASVAQEAQVVRKVPVKKNALSDYLR